MEENVKILIDKWYPFYQKINSNQIKHDANMEFNIFKIISDL